MSKDTIYRQDAIDALEKAIRKNPYYDSNERINGLGVYDVRVVINDLPSAQPEIVRCKDCAKREHCRTSTAWAVTPDDDWYCADAERRTE